MKARRALLVPLLTINWFLQKISTQYDVLAYVGVLVLGVLEVSGVHRVLVLLEALGISRGFLGP